jgi:hypothetical protein
MRSLRLGRFSTVVAAAAALVALGGGLTLAGALSSESNRPPRDNAVLSGKLAQMEHAQPEGGTESTVTAPAPPLAFDRIPAHMLSADTQVPLSPSLIDVENGWLVSDGKTLVAVYAGADSDNSGRGRFVVVRQNLKSGHQTMDVIDVAGAGSLTITDAPKGSSVETSAQHDQIHFKSAKGKHGDLDLTSDSPDVR